MKSALVELSVPTQPDDPSAHGGFELRFDSLFVEGGGMSFPCDARGCVQMDTLSERARNNYLYARAVVGREYRTPAVRLKGLH